jgi:hypothetical protein
VVAVGAGAWVGSGTAVGAAVGVAAGVQEVSSMAATKKATKIRLNILFLLDEYQKSVTEQHYG